MKTNINDIFKIKNSTDNTVDLYFYGDIVADSWCTWIAEDQYPESVKKILEGQDGKALNIHINSCGGSVFAGIAIYNIIKSHKGFKTVYVDGIAASIASIIAFAGDKIIIPSNAFLMVHKPWTRMEGNSDDLRKTADMLDTLENGMLSIYAENLKEGVNVDTIKNLISAETWLTGVQAAEYFNVEVSAEQNITAYTTAKHFKNAPENLINTAQYEREDKSNTAEKIKSTAAKIKSLCISGLTEGE